MVYRIKRCIIFIVLTLKDIAIFQPLNKSAISRKKLRGKISST